LSVKGSGAKLLTEQQPDMINEGDGWEHRLIGEGGRGSCVANTSCTDYRSVLASVANGSKGER
jgi:hypothetical protein